MGHSLGSRVLFSWILLLALFCSVGICCYVAYALPVKTLGLSDISSSKQARLRHLYHPKGTKPAGTLTVGRILERVRSQQSCSSPLGVEVSWSWISRSEGIVYWQFLNPTNESLAVVLNRGATDVAAYPFGGAFFPAYLTGETDGTQLASISGGPYPPLTDSLTIPLGFIKGQQAGVAYVFVVPSGSAVIVPEGGFVNGMEPTCASVVDVRFVENVGMELSYSVCEECLDFYRETGMSAPFYCPANPMETNIPMYEPVETSATFDFWPQQGSTITLGPPIYNESAKFVALESFSGCPSTLAAGQSFIGCFPAESTVERADGTLVPLSALEPGTRIATLVPNNRGGWTKRFTTAYAFADKQTAAGPFQYIALHTSSGGVLHMTPDHLVYVQPGYAHERPRFTRARNLFPGMALLHEDGSTDTIVRVTEHVDTNAYAPLTFEGTLLVDGYLVSSYGDTASHGAAHWAFAPLRLWYRLRHSTQKQQQQQPASNGLHSYAQFLITWRRLLLKI